VPHGDGLPLPEPTYNFAIYSHNEESFSSNSEKQQSSASRTADYLASTDFSNHKITEGELNDLIRDFKLPKRRQNFGIKVTTAEFTTPFPHYILNWDLRRIL
jgi:hypothetical protein